ncbi:MAG TPA: aldehyde dehydrogenase family protein, partial [Anaerolineae bacterium]
FIDGQWLKTGDAIDVRSPYDASLVAVVHRAGPKQIEQAIAAAAAAFQTTRKLPAWKRAEILEKISAGIAARREEFARTIALEAGKPIKTARAEVDRAVFTFKVAAEESKRIYGEIVPLDWLPGTEGRVAHIQRVPLGPVAGISPFNFPLNLVAHKVAPALAAGDPIVLRPASQTPVSALKLAEVIQASGWPEGAFAVIPSTTQNAAPLVEDDRIRLLTFTGSPAVGWGLKSRAGRKRVTLELGGNAGVIVHSDANVAYAAERVTWGGFSYAGQSCISVQRVYAQADVYEPFVDNLIPRVKALKAGNPLDEATDVGPLIDRGAAERVETWVKEARAGGAQVLAGGERDGNLWQPT